MRTRRPFLAAFLSTLVRSDAKPIDADHAAVEMLVRRGLGALACQAVKDGRLAVSEPDARLLQGCDLTARLIHQRNESAIASLVGRLSGQGIEPVLLKGIAVATTSYRPPSARIMGDIDLLVAPDVINEAARVLGSEGYVADAAEPLEGPHHHLQAMRHPKSQVVVELHRELFPPGSIATGLSVFKPGEWRHHFRSFEFGATQAGHLEPALQFAHTIAHWALERKWPTGIFGLLDAALLLENTDAEQMGPIKDWMNEDRWFGACAALVLSYLEANSIVSIPATLQDALRHSRRQYGEKNIRFAHWLINGAPIGRWQQESQLFNPRSALIAWRAMIGQTPERASPRRAIVKLIGASPVASRLNPMPVLRRLRAPLT